LLLDKLQASVEAKMAIVNNEFLVVISKHGGDRTTIQANINP